MTRFLGRLRAAGRQGWMEALRPLNAGLWKLWAAAPLASRPLADAGAYTKLWEQAKSDRCTEIDELERRLGYSVDSEWLDALALQTQIVVKHSALSYAHGRLLYSLARAATTRVGQPLMIVETGTARGFSALCMSKALEDAGNAGLVLTIDVLPHEVPMYWNCIADLGGPRSRRQLLAKYAVECERVVFFQGDSLADLARLGIERVHLAFLDGVHTERYVNAEVSYLASRQRIGDQIVFDDFNEAQFPGVVRAAMESSARLGYELAVIKGTRARTYAIATRVALPK